MHCVGANFAAARRRRSERTGWRCARLHHFVGPDGRAHRKNASVNDKAGEQKSLLSQSPVPGAALLRRFQLQKGCPDFPIQSLEQSDLSAPRR
jgi:hypothetical protein